MDVHTSRPGSADPAAPDRTEAYSYQPYGNVDTGASQDPDRPDGGATPPSPAQAVRDVFAKFAELGEYAKLYVAARTDAFKATMRNAAIYAALGVVGLIALSAVIVTSIVLLCLGIAHGIAALLNGHLWAGYLIAGVLLLGLLSGGAIVGLKMIRKASKKALVKKYELRQRDQRERFGHDAADQAIAEGKVDA